MLSSNPVRPPTCSTTQGEAFVPSAVHEDKEEEFAKLADAGDQVPSFGAAPQKSVREAQTTASATDNDTNIVKHTTPSPDHHP